MWLSMGFKVMNSSIAWKKLARAGTSGGTTHFWAQISHAGRQQVTTVCLKGVAPSATAYKTLDPLNKVVAPRALETSEVKEIVGKFAHAAKVCKECGFTGVQIHGAHGYLISSFLNPLANQRSDAYGGTTKKRAAFLIEILDAVRKAVGPTFPIGVKMNSSDFQKGGFSLEDASEIAKMLDDMGVVDMLEISGGNYENPAMMGGGSFVKNITTGKSTVIREAYFIKMAARLSGVVSRMKLMVTGGFRTLSVMASAIESEAAAVVGIGRPLCGNPRCVHDLLAGDIQKLPAYENELELPFYLRWFPIFSFGRLFRFGCQQSWMYLSIFNIGEGKKVDESGSILSAFFWHRSHDDGQAARLKGLTCEGTILNKKSWL